MTERIAFPPTKPTKQVKLKGATGSIWHQEPVQASEFTENFLQIVTDSSFKQGYNDYLRDRDWYLISIHVSSSKFVYDENLQTHPQSSLSSGNGVLF